MAKIVSSILTGKQWLCEKLWYNCKPRGYTISRYYHQALTTDTKMQFCILINALFEAIWGKSKQGLFSEWEIMTKLGIYMALYGMR